MNNSRAPDGDAENLSQKPMTTGVWIQETVLQQLNPRMVGTGGTTGPIVEVPLPLNHMVVALKVAEVAVVITVAKVDTSLGNVRNLVKRVNVSIVRERAITQVIVRNRAKSAQPVPVSIVGPLTI